MLLELVVAVVADNYCYLLLINCCFKLDILVYAGIGTCLGVLLLLLLVEFGLGIF